MSKMNQSLRPVGILNYIAVLWAFVALACDSDNSEPTDAGSAGGKIEAAAAGQMAGIGSYDLNATNSGYKVSVYDLEGVQLGSAFIEPDLGDWVGRFEPESSAEPNGTLRVMSWREEDDNTVLVIYWLTIENAVAPAGEWNLSVYVTWSNDPAEADLGPDYWELQRIVLETPLADSNAPPGLGGVRQSGDGAAARLLTFDTQGGSATAAELQAWLGALGMQSLVNDRSANVLMALVHDGGLTTALLDGIAEQAGGDDTTSDLSAVKQALSVDDECTTAGLARMADRYSALCGSARDPSYSVRDVCGLLQEDESKGTAIASLFDLFLDKGCQKAHIFCGTLASRYASCQSYLKRSEALQQCEDHSYSCSRYSPGSQWVLVGDPRRPQRCTCLCDVDECASWCNQYLQSKELPPQGESRCSGPFDCVCSLDASSYCQAEFSDSDCGGGEYNNTTESFECNTASCGDGAFTPICEDNPSLNEQCDESAPAPQGRCEDGFKCQSCQCVSVSTSSDPDPDGGTHFTPDVQCRGSVMGYMCQDGDCPTYAGTCEPGEATTWWLVTDRSDEQPAYSENVLFELLCTYSPDPESPACTQVISAQWVEPGYDKLWTIPATEACSSPGQFKEWITGYVLNSDTYRAAISFGCRDENPQWCDEVQVWATQLLQTVETYADPCP